MQVLFLAVSGPKFILFIDDVGDLLQLLTHLPDCLYRLSFRGYRPLNLPSVAKSSKIGQQFWGSQIFAGWRFQKVLRRFVTVVYPLPLGRA